MTGRPAWARLPVWARSATKTKSLQKRHPAERSAGFCFSGARGVIQSYVETAEEKP